MVFLLTAAIGSATDSDSPPFAPGAHTIQFTESSQQADAVEMKYRLHSVEDPGPFDISQAQFQLLVPKNYRPEEAWGLFIWISPGDAPKIPAEWEAVLAARKLLFVGAFQSGNPRNIFDRMRMAVDASVGMRKRYRIDPRRVYISGFSGGARVASMLGVAYPDLFTGTIPFMGVNFYTELPAENGKRLGISYIPDDQALAIAKKECRYVLVTGEKDFNRQETQSAEENGFRKEGFASVLRLEVPGLGHAMPPANWLDKGLEFLDTGKQR
jgi:predicted esterase